MARWGGRGVGGGGTEKSQKCYLYRRRLCHTKKTETPQRVTIWPGTHCRASEHGNTVVNRRGYRVLRGGPQQEL